MGKDLTQKNNVVTRPALRQSQFKFHTMQTTIDNLNKNLAAEKKTSAETKAKVCWDGLATFYELCSLFYVIL